MMGNTSWGWGRANKGSVSDDHVAFVDLPEQDRPEVDGPDPVVGFIQPDVMLLERTGDEEQFVLEPEGAGSPSPALGSSLFSYPLTFDKSTRIFP